MKHSTLWKVLAGYLLAAGTAAAAEPSTADQQAAEKEIRAAAQAFVQVFNEGDAAAVAAHWTADGIFVNDSGERFEGRESIQAQYESVLKDNPDLQLRMEIDSIRLLNSETALEEGRAAITPQPPGTSRVMSRYTAIHVKQAGRWLMADVRDTRVELPPDPGQLEDLEWLVGAWSGSGQDAKIDVTCRWIENRHFLARAHQLTTAGKVTAGGLQIIGLDPSTGRITSWSFTDDGGHAVGIWAPHDRGWVVASTGVMPDGTLTGATNILSRQDENTLVWKSTDRTVGGTLLPDTEAVTLKRK